MSKVKRISTAPKPFEVVIYDLYLDSPAHPVWQDFGCYTAINYTESSIYQDTPMVSGSRYGDPPPQGTRYTYPSDADIAIINSDFDADTEKHRVLNHEAWLDSPTPYLTGGGEDYYRYWLRNLLKDCNATGREGVYGGLYSQVPIRAYWQAIDDKDSSTYATWEQRSINQYLPSKNYANAIYPSLYSLYSDTQPEGTIEKWKTYAIRNLEIIKKHFPGKPIFPYLWPRWHINSNQSGVYIPGDYFRAQLDFLYGLVDGVYIWGPGQIDGLGKQAWTTSPEPDWWIETKDFLNAHPEIKAGYDAWAEG